MNEEMRKNLEAVCGSIMDAFSRIGSQAATVSNSTSTSTPAASNSNVHYASGSGSNNSSLPLVVQSSESLRGDARRSQQHPPLPRQYGSQMSTPRPAIHEVRRSIDSSHGD